MANYSTNLKTWGSAGSEHPDNYNYVQGEQPVDEWDNFLTYNLIEDVDHLISLTNGRIESSVDSSFPSNPEPGEMVYEPTLRKLNVYDDVSSEWNTLMMSTRPVLRANMNVNGNEIENLAGGDVTIDDHISVNGGSLDNAWASKFEGGTVPENDSVSLRAFELADGDTLNITQAHLSNDGFTTAVADGVNLSIVTETGNVETILSGDGSTLYADETGRPHTAYGNSTGSSEVVMVALDNGDNNAGSGGDAQAFGGFIGYVE